jgi:PAS domain S-box-containing protein
MALLVSESTGGRIARTLLPGLLAAPVILGWLRLQGERAGWYGTEAGISLFALTYIFFFGGLIWFNASRLRSSDLERQRTAAALVESNQRTRLIVETALDGIVTMDGDGHIVDFNPAAERIFGHGANDVVGRQLSDVIIPPEMREGYRQGLVRHLSTGGGPLLGRRIEIAGLRADGSSVPLELSICRMPTGDAVLFTGFIRDLTERKKAEADRDLLSSIVNSSDDAIISKTLEGNITAWTRGAEKLLGYSAVEVMGEPKSIVLPPEL